MKQSDNDKTITTYLVKDLFVLGTNASVLSEVGGEFRQSSRNLSQVCHDKRFVFPNRGVLRKK